MKDRVRVLIVDDELLARRRIQKLLSSCPEVESIEESKNGTEAVKSIQQNRPSVVFLDVQMPDFDGFEVLRSLDPEEMPVVVFVTAFDQYALKAFDFHALDYLLKPFDDERFFTAFSRAVMETRRGRHEVLHRKLRSLLEDPTHSSSHSPRELESGPKGSSNQLVVKTGGNVVFLETKDVSWIESSGSYVWLKMEGQEDLLIRETMKSLSERLPENHFVRIHRCTIVNLRKIRELRKGRNGEFLAVLQGGVELTVSQSRRRILEEQLGVGEN